MVELKKKLFVLVYELDYVGMRNAYAKRSNYLDDA